MSVTETAGHLIDGFGTQVQNGCSTAKEGNPSRQNATKTLEPKPTKLESIALEEPATVGSSGKNAARNNKKREKEKKKSTTKFLTRLHEQGPGFVGTIVDKLQNDNNMRVHNLPADHICYRTSSIDEYNALVDALKSATTDCTLLVESTVGGRLIATFRLAKPIPCAQHGVHVVEIPAPKQGRPYSSGLEHVEFVVPSRNRTTATTPENNEEHRSTLEEWMDAHPKVKQWNRKGLDKSCNPDVSTQLDVESYGIITVKFHLVALEDVIQYELRQTSEQATA